MTPGQNRLIGVISAIATAVILIGGGGALERSAAVQAALSKQLTVNAAGGADDSSASDLAEGDVADDSASGSGEAPAEEAPAEAAAEEEQFGDEEGSAPEATDVPEPSRIKHMFVVALAGHGFDATFGPASTASYLNEELVPKGTLLTNYSSLGRSDLADHIALVGGQPPNDDTRAGCPTYKEIPFTASPSDSGEITAAGCVYPNTVTTIGDQLSASRRKWAAYVEDLDKGPRGAVNCRRPESNAVDDTVKARPGDGYATRRNPFVYFHSLLDLGDCDATDGPLERLETDVQATKTTANYSYVAPNLCNSGSESPCVDGSPGGLAAADAFLAKWVPKILASPAYKEDGLLVVTFAGNAAADAAAPDAPARNGTLLISKYAAEGTIAGAEYDPYSLLRSTQDLFGLKPLARSTKARSFADTVLSGARNSPVSDD